ncbi:unnamed protein product [Brassica rapa subsp. trilocularis]
MGLFIGSPSVTTNHQWYALLISTPRLSKSSVKLPLPTPGTLAISPCASSMTACACLIREKILPSNMVIRSFGQDMEDNLFA